MTGEIEVSTAEGKVRDWLQFHMRLHLGRVQSLSNAELADAEVESELRFAIETAIAAWDARTLPDDIAGLLIVAANRVARRLGFGGSYKRRIEFGLKALDVARQRGDDDAIAEICSSTIAWAYLQDGSYDNAWTFAKAGLDAAVTCGSAKWMAEACRILSGVGRDMHDAATARYWAAQARTHAQQLDDLLLEKQIRMDIAFGELLHGNLVEAEVIYRDLLREYIELHDQERVANFYGGLAVLVLHQGRVAEAKGLYRQALQVAKEIDHKVMTAEIEFGLANVLEAEAKALRESASRTFAHHKIKRLSRADQFVTLHPTANAAPRL